MKTCWIPVARDQAGNYLATPGHRYAALIGVDARAPLSAIVDALKNWNLNVTYSWQSGGQPVRQQFLVDRWIASLPAPTAGTVWMYFEMDFTGDVPRTVVSHLQKCVLFVCGSADIAYVFEAQDVADDYSPCGPGDTQSPLLPPTPTCAPPPSPLGPAVAGGAAGFMLGVIVAVVLD